MYRVVVLAVMVDTEWVISLPFFLQKRNFISITVSKF